MFPILLLFGLSGLIAWAAKPKPTGVVGGEITARARPRALPAYGDAATPTGFMGPPLLPEEERLLSLLTLWMKDKKYPAGNKRFLTKELARDLIKLCLRLGLSRTAAAVLRDRALPEGEMLGRRGITIRQAIDSYSMRN